MPTASGSGTGSRSRCCVCALIERGEHRGRRAGASPSSGLGAANPTRACRTTTYSQARALAARLRKARRKPDWMTCSSSGAAMSSGEARIRSPRAGARSPVRRARRDSATSRRARRIAALGSGAGTALGRRNRYRHCAARGMPLLESGAESIDRGCAKPSTRCAVSPARLELARTLIELGAALRRANRRVDARGVLQEGLELARLCNADALAERARHRASRGRRPHRATRPAPASSG